MCAVAAASLGGEVPAAGLARALALLSLLGAGYACGALVLGGRIVQMQKGHI